MRKINIITSHSNTDKRENFKASDFKVASMPKMEPSTPQGIRLREKSQHLKRISEKL